MRELGVCRELATGMENTSRVLATRGGITNHCKNCTTTAQGSLPSLFNGLQQGVLCSNGASSFAGDLIHFPLKQEPLLDGQGDAGVERGGQWYEGRGHFAVPGVRCGLLWRAHEAQLVLPLSGGNAAEGQQEEHGEDGREDAGPPQGGARGPAKLGADKDENTPPN